MDFRFEEAGSLNYQRWVDSAGKYEAMNGLYPYPDKYDATWLANRAGLYFDNTANSEVLRISPLLSYDVDGTQPTLAPMLYQNFTFTFWVRMDGSKLGDGNRLLSKSTYDLSTAHGNQVELISLSQTASDVLTLEMAFMQFDGKYVTSGNTVTTTTTIGGTQKWDRWFHLAVVVKYSWEPIPVTRGFIYVDGVLRSPDYYNSGSLLSPNYQDVVQYYRDSDSTLVLGSQLGSTTWKPTNGVKGVTLNRFAVYGIALSGSQIQAMVYSAAKGQCAGGGGLNAANNPTTKCLYCPAPDSGIGQGMCQGEKCGVAEYLSPMQICANCLNPFAVGTTVSGTCTGSKDYASCYANGSNRLDTGTGCTTCGGCCATCFKNTNTCSTCKRPSSSADLTFASYSDRYTCSTKTHLKAGVQVAALASMSTPSTWSVLFWVKFTDYNSPGTVLDLGSYTYAGLKLKKGTTDLLNTPLPNALGTRKYHWIHMAFTGSPSGSTIGHSYYKYESWPNFGGNADDSETTASVSLTKLTICLTVGLVPCNAVVKGVQVWGITMTRSQIEDSRFMIWEKARSILIFMLPLEGGSGRSTVGPSSNANIQSTDWEASCDSKTYYHAIANKAELDGATSNIMLCPESSNPIQPLSHYNEDFSATCPYRLRWVFNQVCYGDTIADTDHNTLLMRGNSTDYMYNKPYTLNTNAGLYFDGVDDYLTLPNFPGSGTRIETMSSFTYAVWVYPQDKNPPYSADMTGDFLVEDFSMGLVSVAYSSGQPARAFYIKNKKLYIESWAKERTTSDGAGTTSWTVLTNTEVVQYDQWQLVVISGYVTSATSRQMQLSFYVNDNVYTGGVGLVDFDVNYMIHPEDKMVAGAVLAGTGPHSFYRGFLYELQIYNTFVHYTAPGFGHNNNWMYLANLYTKLIYPLSDRKDWVPVGMTQALSWQVMTGDDFCFPLECATRQPYCDRNECCTSCDSTSCLMGGKCMFPPKGQFRHPATSLCTYPLAASLPASAQWRDSEAFADLWEPMASHIPSSLHRRYAFVFDVTWDIPVVTFEGFCSSFFKASTANSFGVGASCFFSNSTTLTVYLGSGPTLQANDTLFFADGVFKRIDEPVTFYTSDASVTLDLPNSAIETIAVITAPKVASVCRSFTLDSRHSWPMVNAKVFWSVTGALVASSPAQTLTLTPTGPGELIVTLTVTNMFGKKDVTSVSITLVQNVVPEAAFPVNRLFVSRDMGKLEIPVVVTRGCGSSSHTFTYQWNIAGSSGNAEALYQKLGALSNMLIIDPEDLNPGSTVTIRVEVAEEKLPGNLGAAEVVLITKPSDLMAVIRGGNREIYYQDALELSALSSFDPDVAGYSNFNYDTAPMDDSVAVTWQCYFRDNGHTYPCGMMAETRFSQSVLTQPVLNIPAGTLVPGLSYTFVLRVKKDTRSAIASTRIDAVATPRTAVWINPYFYGLLTSGSAANIASSTWSVQGASASSVIRNVVSDRPFALLDFSSWAVLARYQFTLDVVDTTGLQGRAFITIENNAFPRHGSLQVNGAGQSYQDTFALAMIDWYDEFLPLTYRFSRVGAEGNTLLLSTRTLVATLNTYLPNSCDQLQGTVYNSLDVSVTVTQPVAVSQSDAVRATYSPFVTLSNTASELMSIFSLYCQLYAETKSMHVLNWAIDIAKTLLANPSCEVTAVITQHAAVVGLDNDEFLEVFKQAISADESFGCVDTATAFTVMTKHLTPAVITGLLRNLGRSSLAWAVPLGDSVLLKSSGLTVSFSRSWSLQSNSIPMLMQSDDPAFASFGATIVKSEVAPGCLDVITMASYSQLNSRPVYSLELRDTGYSSVQVAIIDLTLSYGCQINKFGEIEFDSLPIWGHSPLTASSDLSLSYITYHLPFQNLHEESQGLVRCVQWNGEFWTQAYCSDPGLQHLNVSTIDCTCTKLLPTTARVTQPYTRFDVDLPKIERSEYQTMFQHFNPIHVLIILGCLTGMAAVLAVYADIEAKRSPPVNSCLSYYKEESLYASIFYAYKPESSRLARVTLIAVKWFFMLYILGIWYYHERSDRKLEYYQADAGMAGVVVVLAFIGHAIFGCLLNQNRMRPCIWIGYVLALVFIGSAIIVAFAITRRMSPLVNGIWVITFLSALAMEILIADPCMVGLKAVVDSINRK